MQLFNFSFTQNPYNLERIFWLFSNDDCELIGHLFSQLESSGAVNIPEDLLQRVCVNINFLKIPRRGQEVGYRHFRFYCLNDLKQLDDSLLIV